MPSIRKRATGTSRRSSRSGTGSSAPPTCPPAASRAATACPTWSSPRATSPSTPSRSGPSPSGSRGSRPRRARARAALETILDRLEMAHEPKPSEVADEQPLEPGEAGGPDVGPGAARVPEPRLALPLAPLEAEHLERGLEALAGVEALGRGHDPIGARVAVLEHDDVVEGEHALPPDLLQRPAEVLLDCDRPLVGKRGEIASQ